jgi:uncharacterized secreted protein with C-terminal beta-propeller domain
MLPVLLLLNACGGGGSGSAPTAQGRLIDAPVQGIHYQSGTQSGLTGANGTFTYEVGQRVQFSLGHIVFGSVSGQTRVTPLDLTNAGDTPNTQSINIARFLQSLDSDSGDSQISIPAAVLQRASEETIRTLSENLFSDPDTFDQKATTLLARLTEGLSDYPFVVSLQDADLAQDNMVRTLKGEGVSVNARDPDVRPSAASLERFASDAELETYLKEALRTQPWGWIHWAGVDAGIGEVATDADMGESTTSADQAGSAAPSTPFSGTNLQEEGVDEADEIKSDGQYLYLLARNDQGGRQIRVLKLESGGPPQANPVTELSPTGMVNTLNGLYLVTGREAGQPDLLVGVGGLDADRWGYWLDAAHWRTGVTELTVWNVANPAQPQQNIQISLEGRLISSRRIGEKLYLVTRYSPWVEGMDALSDASNADVLTDVPLSKLLPNLTVDGKDRGDVLRGEHCWRPPADADRAKESTMIVITAVDLREPAHPLSRCVIGPAETVYVSPEALYLATTRQNYVNPWWGGIEPALLDTGYGPPETTDVHQFDLTAAGPRYRASGVVPGHLGWEEDKKSFRMSHRDGVLRMATSLGQTWDQTATTRLTLLGETETDTGMVLTELSALDGIGETGEQLYAVRFVGDRAYLVTFRVTDPLYVFDLSDPHAPRRLGSLHIAGYSDYLHPIGDRLLLGIGKDAIPDTESTDFSGRGAWYQGLKLALFDVSDPAAPKEVATVVVGKRGTESDLLWDHHALAYLPPDNSGQARLALPVQLHQEPPEDTGSDPADAPWNYYGWTHTGLYLFRIETGTTSPTLHLDDQLVVENQTSGTGTISTDLYWEAPLSDRSVLVGDDVHYIHDGQVWSAVWGAAEEALGPQ